MKIEGDKWKAVETDWVKVGAEHLLFRENSVLSERLSWISLSVQ